MLTPKALEEEEGALAAVPVVPGLAAVLPGVQVEQPELQEERLSELEGQPGRLARFEVCLPAG